MGAAAAAGEGGSGRRIGTLTVGNPILDDQPRGQGRHGQQ